jgi:opacity protein-like surface antigen
MPKRIGLAMLVLTTGVCIHAAEAPVVDLFLGYSFLRVNPAGNTPGFPNDGGVAAFSLNFNEWFALESEFGCYYNGNVKRTGADSTSMTYLIGPRLSYGKSQSVNPYFHVLFGAARVSSSAFTETGDDASRHSFAMAVGAGLDFQISKVVSLRPIQMDYLLTQIEGVGLYSRLPLNPNQHNFRVTTGVVFNFGAPR